MLSECVKCPSSIRDIRGRHSNGVGQTLRINGDMAFDARDCLPRVIALMLRCIGILDTLGINDAKARRGVAPLFGTGLANLIFLMPAQEYSADLLQELHSIAESRNVRFAISENHLESCAIGSHF